MTSNRFILGSGRYECRCCKRSTRSTGRGDNENVTLCAQCYDLAGEENHLADNGTLYESPENVRELFYKLRHYGVAEPEKLFPEVAAQL